MALDQFKMVSFDAATSDSYEIHMHLSDPHVIPLDWKVPTVA